MGEKYTPEQSQEEYQKFINWFSSKIVPPKSDQESVGFKGDLTSKVHDFIMGLIDEYEREMGYSA
jgi:hypothetical protein